jgi:5'-deoxynucleotidase YfbR-like HD superfamily hydrolase
VAKGLHARRTGKSEPRAWQRMLSGRRLDLLDPSPLDIEIEDIAHGLARVARWNGQTVGDHSLSVAQHSVVVEEIAAHLRPGLAAKWRLAALLHDAAEYVIGDMISPFKTALGLDYRTFEDRLETAIHVRFGLPAHAPPDIRKLIKSADRASAFYEATQLAGFTHEEALALFGAPPPGYVLAIEPQAPREAQARYVQRYHVLSEAAGYAVSGPAAFDTE